MELAKYIKGVKAIPLNAFMKCYNVFESGVTRKEQAGEYVFEVAGLVNFRSYIISNEHGELLNVECSFMVKCKNDIPLNKALIYVFENVDGSKFCLFTPNLPMAKLIYKNNITSKEAVTTAEINYRGRDLLLPLYE